MKNSTFTALISGCLFLLVIGGCKKPDAVKPAQKTVAPTNTITTATICDYAFSDSTLTNDGWTKVFDDDFSGGLSNWYAYTGGVTNELACNEPANAQVVNGELQLTAKQETITGPVTVGSSAQQTFSYTSASIVSNQAFSANPATPKVRIVARVQVAAGYGLTSIFNSYGQNWPTNGQINFFQVEGNDTKEYSTNYFYGTEAGTNLVTDGMQYNPVDADLSGCYHVYMTEWTQNSISYYLDGKLVETKTAGGQIPQLFNKQQTLALSLPIGGLYYENLTKANIQVGTMHVSYVKVFTSK